MINVDEGTFLPSPSNFASKVFSVPSVFELSSKEGEGEKARGWSWMSGMRNI